MRSAVFLAIFIVALLFITSSDTRALKKRQGGGGASTIKLNINDKASSGDGVEGKDGGGHATNAVGINAGSGFYGGAFARSKVGSVGTGTESGIGAADDALVGDAATEVAGTVTHCCAGVPNDVDN